MSSRTIADRYELVSRLGAGGGGVVWRAHDTSLDRVVAVKEVPLGRELSGDERDQVQARALREARAAARLEHNHVVSVYDVRRDDDAIHIVMQLVDAPSLQQVVDRDGPLAPEVAARVGAEVLEALQAAHAAGIVHRDVKPSNVLLAEDGARVTDFGIAAVTGDTSLTLSGQALGTPNYVSPEQVRDDVVGPATDLWALGATLYFAVEGEQPFRRERSVSTVHAVVHDPPRPMARAGPLAPVIGQLLSKEPGARGDVRSVQAQLRAVARRAGEGDATAAIPPAAPPAPATAPDPSPPATDPSTPTPPPPTTPSPSADPAPPEPASRRRGLAVVVAAAAVTAVVLVAVLVGLPSGDSADVPMQAVPSPGASSPDAPGTEATSPTASGTEQPSPSASATPGSSAAAVPEGWETYEGPGYVVAHPAGWTQQDAPAPNNIDLEAPEDEAGYLRVAHTDDPATDVVQDSERIEAAFRDGHADYERIRLEPTEYRGTDAALWEYTFTADGIPFHAIHLNVSTGDRGYALNHVVPASGWDAAADRFEQFTASFEFER